MYISSIPLSFSLVVYDGQRRPSVPAPRHTDTHRLPCLPAFPACRESFASVAELCELSPAMCRPCLSRTDWLADKLGNVYIVNSFKFQPRCVRRAETAFRPCSTSHRHTQITVSACLPGMPREA